MTQIRLIWLTAAVGLVACVPSPGSDDLYLQDIVLSTYDSSAQFNTYKTFAMPDDLTVLKPLDSGSLAVSHLPATDVINAIADAMKAAGYTQVAQGQKPDLGIGLTALVGTVSVYSTSYYCTYWYYWYYPSYGCYSTYPTSEELYKTKTLLIDLIDLKPLAVAPPGDAGGPRAGIIWTSALYGVMTETGLSYESSRAVKGVGEAFAQSPYLKAGN